MQNCYGVILMRPIDNRKTTKELVYDQLKKNILNGTIGQEEILTETNLADTLQTSRTPVREAIADLLNEGLLVHIPRKGFQVRKIDRHELDQILYLRLSIEMRGVRSEEHTSELQSRFDLVCRLLLE